MAQFLRRTARAQAVVEYAGAIVIAVMAVASVLSVLPQWMTSITAMALSPADHMIETLNERIGKPSFTPGQDD